MECTSVAEIEGVQGTMRSHHKLHSPRATKPGVCDQGRRNYSSILKATTSFEPRWFCAPDQILESSDFSDMHIQAYLAEGGTNQPTKGPLLAPIRGSLVAL